jgi:tripartite-type tricarboxylate transporter receptor subunit TctC
MFRNIALCLFVAVGSAPGTAPAQAASTPPVKILVPVPPGGSSDLVARVIAPSLSRAFNRPFVVENKSGASGRIAAESLVRSKPDGTTLLLTPIAVPVLAPLLYPQLGFDPSRDFAPIAQVATYEFALAVRADHPAADARDLVAWIRAHPRKANFGTSGQGSMPQLIGVLFGQSSSMTWEHIPYRGIGQVEEQVLSGDLELAISAVSDLLEMHRAGRLRILATTGRARSTQLPTVPTLAEQGFAIEAQGWTALFAPAGTPQATIDAMSAAVATALNTQEVRRALILLGVQPTGTTPRQLAAIVNADKVRWAPIVKASGFRPE